MPRVRIPADLDRRVREAAKNRCGYCQSHEDNVYTQLEIEHIIPLAKGGSNDESNLWLACPFCNGHKSDKIIGIDPETGKESSLFNPRTQKWSEHFRWSDDGVYILGLTPIGRATVIALHLSDDPRTLKVRRKWVSVGWYPPKD